ncbi:macro domain-containing protein [Candidatus Berkiella aquae]|uniref:Macro domain-containing protein n=1 Tax=Candidatus Berkiella aquae TaxID=295108 RepID=A0A0Q9Z0E1_9GAMM|nr:macro domain-containing protein [Candidatus Berkiella aquae]MCS5712132.1 macro domain-containing protein [Candidatus Berkiella aquae]
MADLNNLIQQQQATYQNVFLKDPKNFHQPTHHYDWWMFPLQAPANVNVTPTTRQYSINDEQAKTLLRHPKFISTYMHSINKYLNNLIQFGWNKYDVRYAKMLSSLNLFLKNVHTISSEGKMGEIKHLLTLLAEKASRFAQQIKQPSPFLQTSLYNLNEFLIHHPASKQTLTMAPRVQAKPANRASNANVPTTKQQSGVDASKPQIQPARPNNAATTNPLLQQIAIDFDHGLLEVNANAYVNAASINRLPVPQWGGVAGAIARLLNSDNDQQVLNSHWNSLGQCVTPGSAAFVSNPQGQPHLFQFGSNQGLLVHAGSPMWNQSPVQQTQIKNQLTAAYKEVLQKIHQYNQSSQQKVNTVAIPPLGIGIYGIPAEISAQCAFDALTEFYKQNASLKVIFPLRDGKNTASNDYRFGQALKALLQNPTHQNVQQPVAKPVVYAYPPRRRNKVVNLNRPRQENPAPRQRPNL